MIIFRTFLRTYDLKKLILVSFFAFSFLLSIISTTNAYAEFLNDVSNERALMEIYGESSQDLVATFQSISKLSTELPYLKKLQTMIVGGGNLTIITSNGSMVKVLPIFFSEVPNGSVYLSKSIFNFKDEKGTIDLLLDNNTLEYKVKGLRDIDTLLQNYRFTAWDNQFYTSGNIRAVMLPFSFIADHNLTLNGAPIKFVVSAFTNMPPISSRDALLHQLKIRVNQWKIKVLNILAPSTYSINTPLLEFLAFDDFFDGTNLFFSFLIFVLPLVILIVSAYIFLDNVEKKKRDLIFQKIEKRGGHLPLWQQKLLKASIVPIFLAIFSLGWYLVIWFFFRASFFYIASAITSSLLWIIVLFLIIDLRPKVEGESNSKRKLRAFDPRIGIVTCSVALLAPLVHPLNHTINIILLLVCLLFLINHLIRHPTVKKRDLSFDPKWLHNAFRVAIVSLVLVNIGFIVDTVHFVHKDNTIPTDLWLTFGFDGDVYTNVDSIQALQNIPEIERAFPVLSAYGHFDQSLELFYQLSKDSLKHVLVDFPAPIFYQSKSKLLEKINSSEQGILLTVGLANSYGISIGDQLTFSIEVGGKVEIHKTTVLGIIGIARMGYPPLSSDYAIFFDTNGVNVSNMFGIDLYQIPTEQELLELLQEIESELSYEFLPGRVQLGKRLSALPTNEKWRDGDLLSQFYKQDELVSITISLFLIFMVLVVVFPSVLLGIPNWKRMSQLATVLKRRGEFPANIEKRIAKDLNPQIRRLWLEQVEGLVVAFSTWLYVEYSGVYPYRIMKELVYLGWIMVMAVISNLAVYLWIKRKVRRISFDRRHFI